MWCQACLRLGLRQLNVSQPVYMLRFVNSVWYGLELMVGNGEKVVLDLQVAADQYEMARPTSKILNLSLAVVAAGNATSLW